MKNVLVTGGRGFIASYVIEELQRQGFKVITTVRAIDRINRELYVDNFTSYLMDIRDKAGMYSIIQKADGVIHLAGILGSSENMRFADMMNDINIGGTLNILNAIDNFKLPGSFITTGNHLENNPYAISKSICERYALCYAKNFKTKLNITRAWDAVGPRQKWGTINKILPTFINKALRNEDISVYGGKNGCSTIDLIYVGDIAKILVEALKQADQGKIGNLFEAGSGIPIKVYTIAQMVVEACHSKSKIIDVPMRQGESQGAYIVSRNPYKMTFRKLEDYLPETIEYYKQYV